MKRTLFIGVVLALAIPTGCAYSRPLLINWPEVEVQTNLPLSSNGVVVANAIEGMTLTITKRGHWGTSMVVKGLPPGESILVPADPLIRRQTFTITVTAYDGEGRFVGLRSREFTFNNSGYNSRIRSWDVRRSDIR